jgi:O-antigen ligase
MDTPRAGSTLGSVAAGSARRSSVSTLHPLLYWITIAFIVGAPNFLTFDATGRTHDFGLFNATSLSRIALTLTTGYVLIVNFMLARGRITRWRGGVSLAPWLALASLYFLASLVQPQGMLIPAKSTDLPLSLFRLGEWVLGFLLLMRLVAYEPLARRATFAAEIIGRVSWIVIVMVWVMLPLAPNLVFAGGDEGETVAALGGQFYNSGALGFHAGCAFFASLLFTKKLHYKSAGCAISFVTLLLTRARTPLLAFGLALFCYAFLQYRKPAQRLTLGVLFSLFASIGLFAGAPFSTMLTRGATWSTTASLDGRLPLWEACWAAIQLRPFLGYGFVIGAKNAIRDHWTATNWIPPHAHNDILQAMLQGGLLAAILVMTIYIVTFKNAISQAKESPQQLFLLLVLVQLAVISTTGLVLSLTFDSLGASFLLCHIAGRQRTTRPYRRQICQVTVSAL